MNTAFLSDEIKTIEFLAGFASLNLENFATLSQLLSASSSACSECPVQCQFILPMKHKASDNSNVATGSALIRNKKGELWNVHVMLWAGSPISTLHASLFSVEGNLYTIVNDNYN